MRFRCAHVPSGNGVVERCHRSIKVIVARKGCSVAEAVYLYNLMPKDDCTTSTAPANMLCRYTVRIRGEDCNETTEEVNNIYRVGEEVWVRPHDARCDRRYGRGAVTRELSDQAVEINGVPRHFRDLRHRSLSLASHEGCDVMDEECDELYIRLSTQDPAGDEADPDSGDVPPREQLRRSTRERKPRVCTYCD
ncbi:hypothetical protein GWK47_012001 [Chionoecetes opilio]|uniref:Uncharacterized protein n=1 Tax=Chionoecetes opilio TaxID=41210 RepID=A0A8J5CM27_CHIOP|nr:hypothetical protein GWK47_012001 [Chionoecetes opilio]